MSVRSKRPHLGVGWAFPVRPVGGRLQWAREELDVEQAIAIILESSKLERVMVPEFGAGLRAEVFAPNTPLTHRRVESQVRSALSDWEPRIDIEDVRALPSGDRANVLLIHIDYVVRRTNARSNLVFPFYLNEAS